MTCYMLANVLNHSISVTHARARTHAHARARARHHHLAEEGEHLAQHVGDGQVQVEGEVVQTQLLPLQRAGAVGVLLQHPLSALRLQPSHAAGGGGGGGGRHKRRCR